MFRSALDKLPSSPLGTFMTAASPGIIATTLLNAHYDSHEAYVLALARQMRKEYELIARDFILQIDAPDLALERTVLFQDKSVAEFLKIAEVHVAALNEALAGIPRERIRLHCCWGNYDGPHIHDVPLADILPVLTQAKVGALSIEFANPRHQHEYAALKKAKLPPEFLLLPGVIDSKTNFVEHPEVVANRICEAVDAIGDRSRVIASVDCGFGTFAGSELVAEDVVWAKLTELPRGRRHRDPAAVGQEALAPRLAAVEDHADARDHGDDAGDAGDRNGALLVGRHLERPGVDHDLLLGEGDIVDQQARDADRDQQDAKNDQRSHAVAPCSSDAFTAT